MPAKTRETKKEKPVVTVNPSNATYQVVMDNILKSFESSNEGWKARWIYHPVRDTEVSMLTMRSIEGYTMVEPDEVKGDIDMSLYTDPKGHIRFADVVLMKIPLGQWEANRDFVQAQADKRIDQLSESALNRQRETVDGKYGADPTPDSGITVRTEDQEVIIEQRTN